MLVYKITAPDGRKWMAELNTAAALYWTEQGHILTVHGQSPIAQRVKAVREAEQPDVR